VVSSYNDLVINHVELVSTIEKMLSGITFFFPIRFGENELKITAVNSFLECISSYHDHTILKYALLHRNKNLELKTIPEATLRKYLNFPASNVPIATALTAIEHTEVVAEILATLSEQKFPQLKNVKWTTIAIIELIKFYLRLKLLIINGGHILVNRKLPSKVTEEPETSAQATQNGICQSRSTLMTYFRHLRQKQETNRYEDPESTDVDLYIITGELLWITRPIVYLFLLFLYGQNSFWPWIISLLFDISFVRCVSQKKLNKAETAEISKRKLQLLLYILKSPFYDLLSESETLIKIKQSTDKIPLIGNLLPVVADVLKLYNSRYFYTAGSK